jgi:hypothetical protein
LWYTVNIPNALFCQLESEKNQRSSKDKIALHAHVAKMAACPFNEHEPVDSSAAAITAQGLIRLGKCLIKLGQQNKGRKYFQDGLTVANQLFEEPYLSTDPNHQNGFSTAIRSLILPVLLGLLGALLICRRAP